MPGPGVVDAQVHTWGADTPERPWPRGRAHLAQKPYPVTREMILEGMDEAGVDRVVLVPPSWEGDRNDLALEAARLNQDRFAVMGRIDLAQPQPEAIGTWRDQPGMLGLRFTFHRGEQRPWLTDGTAEWAWAACEEHGVPVMVFVPGSLPQIGEVAERHPGLKLVIDHLAMAGPPGPERFEHLDEVLALARYPNVAVKASALPCMTTETYPFPGLHSVIRRVFDAFGPERTFWGTDWTRLPCTWREAKELFTVELPWLQGEDQEMVMGRAICEWLGWEWE